MKRLGIALLALGFLLTGCSSEWQGEVRYKVLSLHESYESIPGSVKPAYARLEIDGAEPQGAVEPVSPAVADLDKLPEGVAVGDVVVCPVRQYDENSYDGKGTEVTVGPCTAA